MKLFVCRFSLLVSLACGCAQTTELDLDGQTHWMTQCDEDADCGDLVCICGTCTETCGLDDADSCSTLGAGRAVCALAANALDTAACSSEPSELPACVPACDRTSDCHAVASDLICTDEGACVLSTIGAPELPDPVDGQGDSVASTAVELRCGDAQEPTGTGTYEIEQYDTLYDLAIAADGTIYATAGTWSVVAQVMRIHGSSTSIIAPELEHVGKLLIDGDQLLVANADGTEITIAAIDRATEEVIVLARQSAAATPGLTADADYAYWTTESSPYHSLVWRSPRVPGESEVIGEISGRVFDHSLAAVGDQLFLLGYPSESATPQLFRIEKAGTIGVTGPIGEAPQGLWDMTSDGQNLFFLLLKDEEDGRAHSIVRMSPDMQDSASLFTFSADQGIWIGRSHDAAYVYWTSIARRYDGGLELHSVWRGRKDGSAGPERLATIDTFATPVYPAGDSIYWATRCPSGGPVNLVKMPLR